MRLALDDESPQVVVDFPSPAGTARGHRDVSESKDSARHGTTGLEASDDAAINAAAKEIAGTSIVEYEPGHRGADEAGQGSVACDGAGH